MSTTPSRFRGKNGKARLLKILSAQKIVEGNKAIAQELMSVATVTTLFPRKNSNILMVEGEYKSDIFFILSGKVCIQIRGKQVNVRHPGDHVGEMSLIDPRYPRSASIIALERTEVARVTEGEFTVIAEKYPNLWRHLCIQLGHRLRQRGDLIPVPNKKPIIFIGSSSKQKRIVNAVEKVLKEPGVKIKKWTKGVFGLSDTTIESLEKTIGGSDFAIIILSGDDTTEQRGKIGKSPRDNCIFELGLGIGALGRNRTFILKEDQALHLPTDLAGVTHFPYNSSPQEKLERQLKKLKKEIKNKIKTLKVK